MRRKRSGKKPRKRQASEKVLTTITGCISTTPAGFGFVTPADDGPDIFIPPKYIGGALDGDEVKVDVVEEAPRWRKADKGPVGHVTEIISRKRKTVVGELIAGRKVRPLCKRFPEDIEIKGQIRNAKRGDWVKVRLDKLNKNDNEPVKGTVEKQIGKVGAIESDLQAVIEEYELPAPYSDAENEEAAAISPLRIERKDLTEYYTVTIDPEDAKDFDDAVSLTPGENKNEVILGVHIADVAAWIPRDSKWDLAARERSFTSYLPGKTLPMLPPRLTQLISLTPDAPCPAHTVLITVNAETGEIIKSSRCHSTIKVDSRLNFDEVQAFIDGDSPAEWNNDLRHAMKQMVELYRRMRAYRQKTEKFLELATSEIRVLCDDKTQQIVGLKKEIQTESDQLVEDFMLAANSEVAVELVNRKIPGMFRIHPEPDPMKLEEFTQFVSGVFGFFPGDLSSKEACNNFLNSLEDDHRKPLIVNAFLRSLPRACYLESPDLHFGLGKNRYSHFTSPIRRYPDLVVHQQLWTSECDGVLYPEKKIAEFAEGCNAKETNNDEAYYAANDRLKLHYLNDRLQRSEQDFHEGMIVKITSSGLQVDIPDLGIYGFVQREDLRGDFMFRKKKGKLISRRGHQEYKTGDFIYLQLSSIDFIRGTALFRPVK